MIRRPIARKKLFAVLGFLVLLAALAVWIIGSRSAVPGNGIVPIPATAKVLSDVGGNVSHGSLDTTVNHVDDRVYYLAGPRGTDVPNFASDLVRFLIRRKWREPVAYAFAAARPQRETWRHLHLGSEVDIDAPDGAHYVSLLVVRPEVVLGGRSRDEFESTIRQGRPVLQLTVWNGRHGTA